MEVDGIDIEEDLEDIKHLPSPEADPTIKFHQAQPDSVPSEILNKSHISCKGVQGQVRFTELLKVIAHNKNIEKDVESSHNSKSEDNDNTDESSMKPLKKAKYPWQVKNYSAQKGKCDPSLEESNTGNTCSMDAEDEEIIIAEVRDVIEPPSKKVKLNNNSVVHSLVENCIKEASRDDNIYDPLNKKSSPLLSNSHQLGEMSQIVDVTKEERTQISRQSNSTEMCSPSAAPSMTGHKCAILASWRRRHIAQSIVDNAINATLEVFSFSFDSATRRAAQANKQNLEDDAVSVALQAHGLQGTDTVLDIADGNNVLDISEQRPSNMAEIPSCHDHDIQATRSSLLNSLGRRSSMVEPVVPPALQTDVLYKAVSAAISQRGLAMNDTV